MTYLELVTLNSAKGLIRSHLSPKLGYDALERIMAEEKKADLEKFGLFDNSTPNYNTYYPDVTQEDLNPNEADYVMPVFRLLSQVVISPHLRAIDFTKGSVLKDSIPLLIGQSLFIDHEMMTGNNIGVIKDAYWQNAYTTDGVKVPAGINGVLMIDGKSNPRIARGVMSNPPSIHSSSVTVKFLWEPSHKKLSEQEFFNGLGQFDKDGQLIRKIVTEIQMYYENSLVPHGADPFAKRVQDGKIVMAKQASKIYGMSFADDTIIQKADYVTQGYQLNKPVPISQAVFSFSDITKEHINNNTTEINNIKDKDMELTALIESLGLQSLNLADEAAFIAHISSKLGEVTTLSEQLTAKDTEIQTLTGKITAKDTEIQTLKTDLDAAKKFEERANAADETIRAEALRLYNLIKGDKADAAIVESFKTLGIPAIQAMIADYNTQVDALMPFTCQDCHSHNVSRQSAGQTSPSKKSSTGNLREDIQEKARLRDINSFTGAKGNTEK